MTDFVRRVDDPGSQTIKGPIKSDWALLFRADKMSYWVYTLQKKQPANLKPDPNARSGHKNFGLIKINVRVGHEITGLTIQPKFIDAERLPAEGILPG
ncbi:MAG: hypothetical protein WBM69_20405, partial [Desulfobacterales bacterium]